MTTKKMTLLCTGNLNTKKMKKKLFIRIAQHEAALSPIISLTNSTSDQTSLTILTVNIVIILQIES